MIKYIVACAISVIALLICKGYSDFVDSSLDRAKAFLSLINHIERKIGGYLTPPSRLGEGFDNPHLKDMIENISSGRSFIDSYRLCRGSLPASVDKVLDSFFMDFGKGSADMELRRARDAARQLEVALDSEVANGEKEKKICSAIMPALAIGIVIWII